MKFQAVQEGQISRYDYVGKSNFIPEERDSFLPSVCLDFYTLSFNFSL